MPQYKIIIVLLLLFMTALLMPEKTTAYVMPAEQLLYLMGANFSDSKTLVLTQSIRIKGPHAQDSESILYEKLWIKSPGLYYCEVVKSPEDQNETSSTRNARTPGGDMIFRRLLMADSLSERMSLLSHMGIDIKSVSLTRFKGSIAYRLGDKDPERPKLLIEKDTFLPIFFCYALPMNHQRETVCVTFKNYEEIGKCWYPFEIEYSVSDGSSELYTVTELEVNTPIDHPLSKIVVERALPVEESAEQPGAEDNQRLKEIIELLKEKYD